MAQSNTVKIEFVVGYSHQADGKPLAPVHAFKGEKVSEKKLREVFGTLYQDVLTDSSNLKGKNGKVVTEFSRVYMVLVPIPTSADVETVLQKTVADTREFIRAAFRQSTVLVMQSVIFSQV